MAQEIEVIIAGDGKVELEVKGVRGRQCLLLTREIETGLGALINRKAKPEFVFNSRVDRTLHSLKIDRTCRADSIDTEGA